MSWFSRKPYVIYVPTPVPPPPPLVTGLPCDWGKTLSEEQFKERRIVWELMRFMDRGGFAVWGVEDYQTHGRGTVQETSSRLDALGEVFASQKPEDPRWWCAKLIFRSKAQPYLQFKVDIIPGQEMNIINSWDRCGGFGEVPTAPEADHGFNEAVRTFVARIVW